MFSQQETPLSGCLSILLVIQVRLWLGRDFFFLMILIEVHPGAFRLNQEIGKQNL